MTSAPCVRAFVAEYTKIYAECIAGKTYETTTSSNKYGYQPSCSSGKLA